MVWSCSVWKLHFSPKQTSVSPFLVVPPKLQIRHNNPDLWQDPQIHLLAHYCNTIRGILPHFQNLENKEYLLFATISFRHSKNLRKQQNKFGTGVESKGLPLKWRESSFNFESFKSVNNFPVYEERGHRPWLRLSLPPIQEFFCLMVLVRGSTSQFHWWNRWCEAKPQCCLAVNMF